MCVIFLVETTTTTLPTIYRAYAELAMIKIAVLDQTVRSNNRKH